MSLCRRTSIFSEEGATWHVDICFLEHGRWPMADDRCWLTYVFSDVGNIPMLTLDVDMEHQTSDMGC